MKRSFGANRTVPACAVSELLGKSTQELLARLERLRRCEESLSASDMTADEVEGVSGILFKDSEAWRAAYQDVKKILSSREHVSGGVERKEARLESARRGREKHRRRGQV